ncbi:MAG: ROK family transcriptional regulator [Planctomycetes bacterium]|nr:ROK family transcriptional regulator [Planctomycetota bacterium]
MIQFKARDKLEMKLHNRTMIWELIVNSRPISRAQLAKITGMSPTSITRIVGDLLAFGLLTEVPSVQNGVGRKAVMLDVERDAVLTLGIDLDVDSIKLCLLDLHNQIRAKNELRHDNSLRSPTAILARARTAFAKMLAESGIPAETVRAVGISVGGTVDHKRGVVTVSPQLHWENVQLGRMAGEMFGLTTVVENDVKAAIIEEFSKFPQCRAEDVAYLNIGSGIGAALMHDGNLLRGSSNAAGEIGHITVQPNGDLCDCGRYGCLYTCLSESTIIEKLRRFHGESACIPDWVAAYESGETWAAGLAGDIANYIAMALNQLLCCYDPEVVIAGGRLLHCFPALLDLALGKKGLIYEVLSSDARIFTTFSPGLDAMAGAAIIARRAYLDALLQKSL